MLGTWAGDRPRAQQSAAGAAYPEAMFSGLRWRSVGPDRGGRSIAVAGSAVRPFEYYFGATGGGLWKTTDGGTTWSPAADRFLKTSSVGEIDRMTQQNAALVEESAAAESLREQAARLSKVVQQFRLADEGNGMASLSRMPASAPDRALIGRATPQLAG